MYKRYYGQAQKRSFLGNFVLLLSVVIVLSFAYGFLPTGMTAARGIIDVLQFIAMAVTMAYTLKMIVEDF